MSVLQRRAAAVLGVVLTALATASAAFAHAHVSPPVSVTGTQLYSLAVPTEKAGVTTTKVVLTVPKGFGIDSFVAAPGWSRSLQQSGSGESAVVQKVTWTGGHTPIGEDSLFQFLAQPGKGRYTFQVEQTYSDGSIVNWSGPEASEDPAPAIEARSSLGGGGVSLLTIVALAAGALGVVIGVVALVARAGPGGRQIS